MTETQQKMKYKMIKLEIQSCCFVREILIDKDHTRFNIVVSVREILIEKVL